MPLLRGTRIDRYEVLDLLGAGGMGEVYRARDPRLERLVALKILRLDVELGPDGGARLLREARAAAALSHPNVLAIYDVGEVWEPETLRGTSYIAMELVVGASLRNYVGDAAIPMDRRIAWMKDVARALASAHEAAIVHRDVKPENVMIRFDGVVKVLDFGIARRAANQDVLSTDAAHSLPTAKTGELAVSAFTARGATAGTPFYMAPEQLRGEAIDGRADQFAWGVVAYELLTERPPWQRSSNPLSVGLEILTVDPRAATQLNPRVPPEVSETIQRAMGKRPEDRFRSMAELVATLDAIETRPRDGTASTKARAAAKVPGSARGSRRVAGAAVMVALGAASLGIGGLAASRATGKGQAPALAASAIAAGEACTSSAACSRAHGGAAWRCSEAKHACVELTSVDCEAHAEPGDLARDDTVWLGGMFPRDTTDFAPEALAVDLARRDFAHALGSLSALADGSHPRPIATVVCDETADPLRAAHHLADDVEVPAVLGFWRASAARKTLSSVFLPARILSFVTISQIPALMKIPGPPGEPRLVWRSTLDGAAIAGPIAALASDVVEARRKATGAVEPLRIAVLRNASTDDAYTTALFEALRFNGRSALENGDDYRQFVVDEAADGGTAQIVSALVEFAPHVVIPQLEAFESEILVPLEAEWRRGSRPYYLIGSDFSQETVAFAGKDPERRHRFLGVTNFSTTMTNAQLVLHYNVAHPNEPVSRTGAPQPSYDAFFTLAYAVHALGDAKVSGPALSRALDRLLPPGKKVDVGPAGILDAFERLRAGENIDLNGAIGSLDFDRATGEAPIDYAVLCLGANDHGAPSPAVESGLVYSASRKALTGTFHCR